jgi:hypothetical protein
VQVWFSLQSTSVFGSFLWLNPLDLQLDMVCKRLANLFKGGLPISPIIIFEFIINKLWMLHFSKIYTMAL